jgi:hypothetical protein
MTLAAAVTISRLPAMLLNQCPAYRSIKWTRSSCRTRKRIEYVWLTIVLVDVADYSILRFAMKTTATHGCSAYVTGTRAHLNLRSRRLLPLLLPQRPHRLQRVPRRHRRLRLRRVSRHRLPHLLPALLRDRRALNPRARPHPLPAVLLRRALPRPLRPCLLYTQRWLRPRLQRMLL